MFSLVIDRISDIISRMAMILMGVAVVSLVPMMFLVGADVIGRYVFNSPIPAVFEINTNFLMVIVVFLPMAAVHVRGEHVFVSLFTEKFPQRVKSGLDAFSVTMGAIIFALIGWCGVEVAVKATKVQEYSPGIIDVPVWMARWIVPMGAFVFSAELLISGIKHMRTVVNSSSG